MQKKASSSRTAAASTATTPLATVKGMLSPQTFPAIHEALAAAGADRLAAELHRLLESRLLVRPPRRQLKRMARLQCGAYDEVVMLKDVSVSGVRLLLPSDSALDLKLTLEMTLVVRLPDGRHKIPLTLVRLCGREGNHLDIGCKFLGPGPQLQSLVTEIRNQFFDE